MISYPAFIIFLIGVYCPRLFASDSMQNHEQQGILPSLLSMISGDFHREPHSDNTHSKGIEHANMDHRRLQFENMFENNQLRNRRKKKTSQLVISKSSRSLALSKYVEEMSLSADRYHLWWTGPPETVSDIYKRAEWSANHNENNNALFTMAIKQGVNDKVSCSSPNDFKLFVGTLRRVYQGDIVLAVESSNLTPEVIAILKHYNVVVYEISKDLCFQDNNSIFCGSKDERVPASVFRYFFFEKWSFSYSDKSLLMIVDFRDVVFQSDPFTFQTSDWFPEHQLAVFQEFYPNMVINRCHFNTRIMVECYGEEALRSYGRNVIISSGGILGTRDAIAVWSRYMTMQLQEAPGRMVESRCSSGGIEHSFINYLIYGQKLRTMVKIKQFLQGDGPVNSLGGLRPDTVAANVTGDLKSFWKILDSRGYILNWSGEISPVVHQLDHYLDELESIAESLSVTSLRGTERVTSKQDFSWQGLASSRCLWGCESSPKFT